MPQTSDLPVPKRLVAVNSVLHDQLPPPANADQRFHPIKSDEDEAAYGMVLFGGIQDNMKEAVRNGRGRGQAWNMDGEEDYEDFINSFMACSTILRRWKTIDVDDQNMLDRHEATINSISTTMRVIASTIKSDTNITRFHFAEERCRTRKTRERAILINNLAPIFQTDDSQATFVIVAAKLYRFGFYFTSA